MCSLQQAAAITHGAAFTASREGERASPLSRRTRACHNAASYIVIELSTDGLRRRVAAGGRASQRSDMIP